MASLANTATAAVPERFSLIPPVLPDRVNQPAVSSRSLE